METHKNRKEKGGRKLACEKELCKSFSFLLWAINFLVLTAWHFSWHGPVCPVKIENLPASHAVQDLEPTFGA